MAGSIEQLSYELTAAALAEQERALNALRTRAGTIIAAASISGSFHGARVGHGSLDAWAILALIAFVLCLGCAIWVLLPHSFVFAFHGEALLGISDQQGVGEIAEAYRAVGIWIEPYLDANRDKSASSRPGSPPAAFYSPPRCSSGGSTVSRRCGGWYIATGDCFSSINDLYYYYVNGYWLDARAGNNQAQFEVVDGHAYVPSCA